MSASEAATYRGLLYRALNPIYARDPLSGEGARRHGGRFNARGTPALYLSLSPNAALREANQVGTLQPTTLVAYHANLAPLLDSRDGAALAAWDTTPADLADPDWRGRMLAGGSVPTQDLAERLVATGYVRFDHRRPTPAVPRRPDCNIVLWQWNTGGDDALAVVDDEGRLG